MEEKVKRTRSSNFTNKEKAIFVDVLPDYLNIIENKKTDGISVRHKEFAWEKLANEYNSHPEVTKRTVKQLKVFYDSFKRQSKKNYVNEKVALYQTGGGLPTVPKNNDTSNKLLSLIKDQVQPLKNSKDSDVSFHNDELLSTIHDDPESFTMEDAHESPALQDELSLETLQEREIQTIDLPVISLPSTSSAPAIPATENEQEDQEIVASTVSQSTSWMTRNRPSIKRNKSQTVIASKKLALLADKINNIVELEQKVIEDNKVKNDELMDLKIAAEKEKLKAYQAKRQYYESKLANLSNKEA